MLWLWEVYVFLQDMHESPIWNIGEKTHIENNERKEGIDDTLYIKVY